MGFGQLEVVFFDPRREKTVSVTRWAKGRRFAWLDDEYPGDRSHGERLYVAVNPLEGLTREQVITAAEWLR